jgi:hypothetical protein
MAIFYLDLPDNPILSGLSLRDCLKNLRMGFQGRDARYQIGEADFFKGLSSYLVNLVEARLKHVSQWLTANTERFGEKGEITGLIRTFDNHCKELRASVTLCGSKCSSCGLVCLEHKQHTGKHHCQTSHRCVHLCEFVDQHDEAEIPECEIPFVFSLLIVNLY